jgi:hypothetical protein
MRHRSVVTALSVLAAVAGPSALRAQSSEKPSAFQVTGGAMFPVFSYADATKGTGWTAGAAFVLQRGYSYHVRLEGEYNTVGSEVGSGKFDTYGGGVGGGRVFARSSSVRQEAYFVAGGYEFKGQVCTGGASCADHSELQFGTKVGGNAVFGHGKAKFVLDFHWLYTWSQPYVNILAITGGLRF